MKNILPLLLMLLATSAHAQFTDDKQLNIPTEKVLYLPNINGSITVIAENRSDIMVSYQRELNAPDTEILERAKSTVVLQTKSVNDTVLVYIDGICGSEKWKNTTAAINKRSWYTEDCNDKFRFKLDMELRVPANQDLHLSTVNNGDISVSGVSGMMSLHNVNGSIRVDDAANVIKARTINGDVDIAFLKTPQSGSYYTLNGDINMNLPKGFSTRATFKSFNGDIYTNVPDVRQEPMITKKEEKGKGTSFRAELNTMITIREGGGLLDIETFNGNAYIREN
ncbi:DUF4097 family beta strand repeat-containing protein [Fulvivirga sedimenti]|uniref:DUF4097 family beta strand repeat-containing protein n=1 Tax=Fulvivirga sedimenti TaxID=2879465 RepID=A0A9X1HUS2_9BACT|nr:DUF4097 family beta strand repeat-containing protein [Fulvivirga sedimenti]MCA6075148.1 DUF4097 family beta strand repeat-containing protein [Fulvivirga sedimenti]MCA6076325.1 DUF4097 family beta strand repeat-containing protein [Fulvivirga sedimenti]MCA6077453.1 DUF4097 family beta strand repeat-containing protein [Fulvivirga sedimenti]